MLKKLLLTTALLAGMTAAAQQAEGQFSIATLDVDGQPQKVLFFHLNDDGPGSAGTVRIGQYLAKRGYDLVFTQEDFNYHDELTVLLEDDYQFDTWSGSVGLDEQQIDYLHLQNHRYTCDGLGACIKQGIAVGLAERTPWLHTFGKFSHAHDELVTKGFRRYELTLPSGDELVVYNMHCDGSDPVDERAGNDQRDRQARLNEWIQLRDDILSRIDERPVIVVGHTASYYQRDDIHAQFIEAINASGRATAADVWVELQHEGIYPQLKEDATDAESLTLEGETTDKIIYINPAGGSQIQAVTYKRDTEGYLREGKPLGGHFPVSATFEWKDRKSTGINQSVSNPKNDGQLFDLSGRRIGTTDAKGIYIERNGKDTRKRIVK